MESGIRSSLFSACVSSRISLSLLSSTGSFSYNTTLSQFIPSILGTPSTISEEVSTTSPSLSKYAFSSIPGIYMYPSIPFSYTLICNLCGLLSVISIVSTNGILSGFLNLYFANTYNEFHEYLSFKTTFSIVSSSYKTFPSTSTCFTVKSFNAIRKRSAKTIIIIDKIFRKCRNLFFFFRFSLIILSPTKFVSSQNYIFSSFMPFDTDNTSPISAIRKITDVPP